MRDGSKADAEVRPVDSQEAGEIRTESIRETSEQSAEDISKHNKDAELEVRRAQQGFDDLSSKIDGLLTTIDLSSSRDGKTYKGFEGMKQALEDAKQIIANANIPSEGLVDAMNNILGNTKQKMEIVLRDTAAIAHNLEKAEGAVDQIKDESKRETNVDPLWKSDAVAWEQGAREILDEIDEIESDALKSTAQAQAHEAASTAAEEIGW